jgi:hypothetical protein
MMGQNFRPKDIGGRSELPAVQEETCQELQKKPRPSPRTVSSLPPSTPGAHLIGTPNFKDNVTKGTEGFNCHLLY